MMRDALNRYSIAFFNMISSRLWIIRKLVFIILFLISDIIFDYGAITCAGFHFQSKENASKELRIRRSEDNSTNAYFHSVKNGSRALEDVIYSDVLNNLRSLVKAGNYQSGNSNKKEYKTDLVRGKSGNIECDNRNQTGSKTNEWNSYKANVFLNGANEIINKKGNRYALKNLTLRYSEVNEDEYLLGFSGSPFGSPQPVTGIVEIPKNDFLGREVIDPRKKRSVLHLYNMVLCTTGCNPFAYKGYGCYCGFLGSGFVVDGIDRCFVDLTTAGIVGRNVQILANCCKMHDWCYNSAGCPMFLEYFIPYLWKCYRHQPLCAIDHGHYGGPGSCAQRLCECDRQLAHCLRKYPCPTTKALCTSSPWRLLQNILML